MSFLWLKMQKLCEMISARSSMGHHHSGIESRNQDICYHLVATMVATFDSAMIRAQMISMADKHLWLSSIRYEPAGCNMHSLDQLVGIMNYKFCLFCFWMDCHTLIAGLRYVWLHINLYHFILILIVFVV